MQIDDDTLISRKGIIVNDDKGLTFVLNPGSITRITDDEAWLWNMCSDHSKGRSVTFGELAASFIKISNEDRAVVRRKVRELVMVLYNSSTLDIRKN